MEFYKSRDDTSNFVISFTDNPRHDFGIFARGYFHSAQKLSEQLLSNPRFSDYEAYPIVFLYRHSLELYLKNIVYKSILLSKFKGVEEVELRLVNNHKLIPLSNTAQKILDRLFPDDEDLRILGRQIISISTDFSVIDPDSYSYRYPVNKQGGYSTKPHQFANLGALHSSMSDLLTALDVIDFGFDIEIDIARDLYQLFGQLKLALTED